jgi:flagellar basal-body rod modification protein FlgD
MMPGISPTAPASAATTSSTGSSATTPPVDKNMFLQLLVAQLRNQDPMNPTDGTQFVAQLAQFQQLEQSVNSGQDISAMRADLDQLIAQTSATTTTTTGATTTGTSTPTTKTTQS